MCQRVHVVVSIRTLLRRIEACGESRDLWTGIGDMASRLKSKESVKQGVVRAIGAHAAKSLEGFGGGHESISVAVHRARVGCKRIRAILLLVRPALGPFYAVESESFRDASRQLSELRDANAAIEAIHRLGARYRDRVDPELVERLCLALVCQSAFNGNSESRQLAIQGFALEVSSAVARIPLWSSASHGFSKAIRQGFIDTYCKGAKAFQKASIDPSEDNLHEWRKWIKALLYQLKFLPRRVGGSLHRNAIPFGEIAEALGHAHDLVTLRESVVNLPNQPWTNLERDRFLEALDREREGLDAHALSLGSRLYAEMPKTLEDDFRLRWKALKH